ncbi:MAG: PQQ-dependent sugar dehydrogenase [Crocinitomicaceae bacterium]
MKPVFFCLLLAGNLLCTGQSMIMVGNTEVDVDTVITGLDIPWEIIYGPDDHIWTTERKGIVSRINPTTGVKNVVLDLTDSVYQQSESGLLGMALHPNFAATPEVFLAYTYGSFNTIRERFVKYTYNGSTLTNPVILIDDITGNTTHIGARFQFLSDNTILVSTGDAQNTSLPQNLNSLSGKILRMNTDGTIPIDNPDAASYVYSYGHRNVQGMFLAPNGLIYLSEHGASSDDEFQLLEPGRNYGWPNVEGFCDLSGEQTFCTANYVKEPLTVWTPTIAPSDMIWYENSNFPELDGKMLMTVLKDKKLIALELSADGTGYISQVHYLTNQFGRLRDICIGPDKEIYLATNGASWSNTNPNTHSIIRLKVTNTTAINDINSIKLRVYPNPTVDLLYVQLETNQENILAEITDYSGRSIVSCKLENLNTPLSVVKLAKGSYYLKLTSPEGVSVVTTFIKN